MRNTEGPLNTKNTKGTLWEYYRRAEGIHKGYQLRKAEGIPIEYHRIISVLAPCVHTKSSFHREY
eukprot:4451773-Amphidinium_carterae.1